MVRIALKRSYFMSNCRYSITKLHLLTDGTSYEKRTVVKLIYICFLEPCMNRYLGDWHYGIIPHLCSVFGLHIIYNKDLNFCNILSIYSELA